MKKKINIAALALIMVASAGAQTIYDGAKFTQKDLNGTALLWGQIRLVLVYIVVMI